MDAFEDEPLTTQFNGKPSAIIQVFEVGDQSPLEISKKVAKYVEEAKPSLPPGVELIVARDGSFYLKGRLNMLIKNSIIGLILVFISLTLFLRPSLAVWVTLGIPISFLGAFIMLPFADVSINLISLFGFTMVLGIVVDDAIVVGESVFSHFQKYGPSVESSIAGAQAVATPVTFAVMTTAVAFAPILFIPGFLGKILTPIPFVVIFTLLFSLVESKVILPYHLSLCKVGRAPTKKPQQAPTHPAHLRRRFGTFCRACLPSHTRLGPPQSLLDPLYIYRRLHHHVRHYRQRMGQVCISLPRSAFRLHYRTP